ncbi:unnamed protein product, partial [Prorocentrum cordatum]
AWLFCGRHWVRVIGLPRGQGLVGGSCCRSRAQLEHMRGAGAVREELRTRYEALSGVLEAPGVLKMHGSTAAEPPESGSPLQEGSFERKGGAVVQTLPSGELLR